jgi:DNA-binding MarR family transcriptional regulator
MTHSSHQTNTDELVLLIKIGHLITKRLNKALVTCAMTYNQVHVLFLLHAHASMKKSISMRQLAEELMVSLPNVNGLVSRLERDGLAKKNTDSRDQRVHYITITTKGEKILKSLMADWPPAEVRDLHDRLHSMDTDERAALKRALALLSDTLCA